MLSLHICIPIKMLKYLGNFIPPDFKGHKLTCLFAIFDGNYFITVNNCMLSHIFICENFINFRKSKIATKNHIPVQIQVLLGLFCYPLFLHISIINFPSFWHILKINYPLFMHITFNNKVYGAKKVKGI